ncbi:MAG: tol-pal system protein YbgF [Deltaproteobacteria bacterium]
MKARHVLVAIFLFIMLLLVGCATTRDIAYLQGEVDDLQHKVEILRGRVTSEMQQNWVDYETTLAEMQQEIKILRANIEEDRQLLNKIADDVAALKKDSETIGSPSDTQPGEITAATTTPPSSPTPEEEPQDMEGAYRKAYGTFKAGDYPGALKLFEAFLRTYPKSEYADNARFWIGESYYQQGDFERAILEYEKVLKQYPTGDKVPHALLKQGYAFLSLGDRVDAKLLFQKVIKEYPQSPQAEIAAKKLKVLD